MANREDLKDWVVVALKANGGSASVVDVAKHIWSKHEADLRGSGDLFYRWQYEMRWAAYVLRKEKILAPARSDRHWALK